MIHTKLTINVTLENHMAAFIAYLAISPQKLYEYLEDPERTMTEAGLSDQEKNVLRSGDWKMICEFLSPDDTRPLIAIDG